MCKNTCRISFFLVAYTLLVSRFHLILCEEDDSKPLMEDLNQLQIPCRKLADTRTGDFSDQKKLSIFIRKSGGGSSPGGGGSSPARGGGSSPARGGGSSPGRGGGSSPARGGGSSPARGGGSSPGRGGGSSPARGGGSRPVIGAGAVGTGSKSGGSRISSSFNDGCVLSIVFLHGFFL